mmetsp:Transcript_10578/g.39873  ORF Transcript_10578/g.39873 Transcript_10578/m.39873 type:complete len:257 (+) Transcript_10578:391-1161(+)
MPRAWSSSRRVGGAARTENMAPEGISDRPRAAVPSADPPARAVDPLHGGVHHGAAWRGGERPPVFRRVRRWERLACGSPRPRAAHSRFRHRVLRVRGAARGTRGARGRAASAAECGTAADLAELLLPPEPGRLHHRPRGPAAAQFGGGQAACPVADQAELEGVGQVVARRGVLRLDAGGELLHLQPAAATQVVRAAGQGGRRVGAAPRLRDHGRVQQDRPRLPGARVLPAPLQRAGAQDDQRDGRVPREAAARVCE